MMYAFIRWWARIFLRLYFRRTIIYGKEKVPIRGPLILASNHPSAFLEASILSTVMPRSIHFLVRGDMFHPKFRWLFNWTKQIPIYRQKDGISNLRKNASSFDLTYKKLAQGESVLIFPEAKTILEKKMRPIQRGTAHLAFGTIPFMKAGEDLVIQPVGVNFTEPRIPGSDVVVRFGEPFITEKASREDREAIERFTEKLSQALSPLIIQVSEENEKHYDVLASVYFRLLYENHSPRDAHADLMKIAAMADDPIHNTSVRDYSERILHELKRSDAKELVYFPDILLFNRPALAMLLLLKITWLIAGGWIWRLVRNMIYAKIRTATFQAPTSVGIFMVVMPLVTFMILMIMLIAGIQLYYFAAWLLVILAGTLIRPSLKMIWKSLTMNSKIRVAIRHAIVQLRNDIENIIA